MVHHNQRLLITEIPPFTLESSFCLDEQMDTWSCNKKEEIRSVKTNQKHIHLILPTHSFGSFKQKHWRATSFSQVMKVEKELRVTHLLSLGF